jgi:hypothetical protein
VRLSLRGHARSGYGWRIAIMGARAPGIVLALFIRLLPLRDPPRGNFEELLRTGPQGSASATDSGACGAIPRCCIR